MMRDMIKKYLRIMKLFILGLFIILLVRCFFAYNAAIGLKEELIEQFEIGYIDYLCYINSNTMSESAMNIFPKYITDTFKNENISARYIMLKDSIILYKKAKNSAQKDGLNINNIKLYLLNEMSLIVPTPFNKVHMDLYFREFARVDGKYDINGNIRKLEVRMVKKDNKWDVEYIISKPIVIRRKVV